MSKYDKVVFFDTETVGLNPNYIISLAYRFYERDKDVKIGEIRCNPCYPINKSASETNGFTDEMVRSWPTFEEQWDSIKNYFTDSVWIGHNVDFDEKALKLEFKRYNIEVPEHTKLDTMKIARQMLRKPIDVPNHKLGTLCDYFGIKPEGGNFNYHSADYDIWATYEVFKKERELNKLNKGKYDSYFIPM